MNCKKNPLSIVLRWCFNCLIQNSKIYQSFHGNKPNDFVFLFANFPQRDTMGNPEQARDSSILLARVAMHWVGFSSKLN